MDPTDTTPQPAASRPPVNYVQLVVSIVAVLLVGTNIITWFHFREELRQAAQTPGTTKTTRPTPRPETNAIRPSTELSREFAITNAHDHLYMLKHLDKYVKAADRMGIVRTVFVASSEFTFLGTKGDMEKLNDWSTREILTASKQYPGKIVPFATLHPNDPDKVALLKGYVVDGVKGLKLYTGHSNFHDRSLDVPEMDPVYAYCEETGLPMLWHVNMTKYASELFSVLEKYPNLTIIVPHFGVAFWRPEGKTLDDVALMLDTYPNVYVDTSFGTREILVGGLEKVNANLEIFKDFYNKYQDRIVWGTDMVVTGNSEKTEAWVESVIRVCRDLHEKENYTFWMGAQGSGYAYGRGDNIYGEYRGLNLPQSILKKIYETNMDKVLARVM